MLHFHAHVFARPAFPVPFEQAQSRLMLLSRMDTEPDGYFLLAGESAGQHWHVNGQLFEHSDKLHRVELHGSCPEHVFDDLLRCFGWPEVEVEFELIREGLMFDEAGFRERARNPE